MKMSGVSRRRRGKWGGNLGLALAAVPLFGACYVYRPVTTADPQPGMRLALDLNDEGRTALVTSMGPDAARVEGAVVSSTTGEYVLRVSEVRGLHGSRTKWSGETVSVRQEYARRVREKRLSSGRTAALVGGVVGAMVGLAAGVHLVGFGGAGEGKGDGAPGNDQ